MRRELRIHYATSGTGPHPLKKTTRIGNWLFIALFAILAVPQAATAVSWTVETVQSSSIGTAYDFSIAVDSFGHPYISYASETTNGSILKLAAKLGAVWTFEIADSTANIVGWTSLALYNNEPRISYNDHSDYSVSRLKFATRSGSAWTNQILYEKPGSFAGEQTSLAIDATGKPQIASINSMYNAKGFLAFMQKQISGWAAPQTLAEWYASYPSLALDSGGAPRISYHFYDENTRKEILRFSSFNGSWSHSTLAVVGDWADSYTSLAIDSSNRAHILFSYYDTNTTDTSLRYIRQNSGGWDNHEFVAAGSVYKPSLAVDSEQNPHICYYSRTDHKMRYAHRENGIWATEDIPVWEGDDCSIALDSADQPHIAFLDGYGNLIYARPQASLFGKVVINAEPSAMNTAAPWTLVGPGNFSRTGQGDQALTGLNPGEYTLTWNNVSSWFKPSPASATQSLAAGGKITFTGTYTEITPPRKSPTPGLLLLLLD